MQTFKTDSWSAEYHQVAYDICLCDSAAAVLCAVGVWRIMVHLRPPQNSKVRTLCKHNFCTYILISSLNMKITKDIAVTPTTNSVNVLAEVLVEQVLGEWLGACSLARFNLLKPSGFFTYHQA